MDRNPMREMAWPRFAVQVGIVHELVEHRSEVTHFRHVPWIEHLRRMGFGPAADILPLYENGRAGGSCRV